MVSESLETEQGTRGEGDILNKHNTLEKAYRNTHRWKTHPKVNVRDHFI